jgi:hypothetical protein
MKVAAFGIVLLLADAALIAYAVALTLMDGK